MFVENTDHSHGVLSPLNDGKGGLLFLESGGLKILKGLKGGQRGMGGVK